MVPDHQHTMQSHLLVRHLLHLYRLYRLYCMNWHIFGLDPVCDMVKMLRQHHRIHHCHRQGPEKKLQSLYFVFLWIFDFISSFWFQIFRNQTIVPVVYLCFSIQRNFDVFFSSFQFLQEKLFDRIVSTKSITQRFHTHFLIIKFLLC